MAAAVLECKSVVFAHAVNTREKLKEALGDPYVNFLEADVICGVSDDGNIRAVMGHDPGTLTDFTFAEFVDACAGKGKGVKVDIKEWRAVDDVLSHVRRVNEEIKNGNIGPWPFLRFRRGKVAWFDRPAVMINADILTGNTITGCKFNPLGKPIGLSEQIRYAKDFVGTVLESFESAILSLGWTTTDHPQAPHGHVYTGEMIDSMKAVVDEYARMSVAITFAVKAPLVRASWPVLQELLAYPLTTLTLWSHRRPYSDESWFAATLDDDRTMYDIGKLPQDALWWQRMLTLTMTVAFISTSILINTR